jgi:hypothetical protein
VLNGSWEASGSDASRASNFPKWYLRDHKGREHGYIRCAFRKMLDSKIAADDAEWNRVKAMAEPKQVVVRVYVLEGTRLRAMDRNGSSDPYVLATLTGEKQHKQGNRDNHHKGTLNPDFRQTFEFEITLPGPALLKLQVKDWDRFTPDDDIGYTIIDLEHRYFSDVSSTAQFIAAVLRAMCDAECVSVCSNGKHMSSSRSKSADSRRGQRSASER